MFSEAALVSFTAALFSIMNPVGTLGVFVGMTEDRSANETRYIAWKSAGAIAITLLIVNWFGVLLLQFFGITVHLIRAAGGIILLIIGIQMLFNKSEHKHSHTELKDAESRESIAVVPMAIPIVAGPGAMATVLMAAQQHSSVLSKVEISIVIVCLAAITGLLFSFARSISKRLGESGMAVVTRVMGLILASIAMGMLTEGLKSLLPGLAG
jgi:multiple antibiotic resistance protein